MSIANVLAAEKSLNRKRIASCDYTRLGGRTESHKRPMMMEGQQRDFLQMSYEIKHTDSPQHQTQWVRDVYDDTHLKFNRPLRKVSPEVVYETKQKKLSRKRRIHQLMKVFHSKVQ